MEIPVEFANYVKPLFLTEVLDHIYATTGKIFIFMFQYDRYGRAYNSDIFTFDWVNNNSFYQSVYKLIHQNEENFTDFGNYATVKAGKLNFTNISFYDDDRGTHYESEIRYDFYLPSQLENQIYQRPPYNYSGSPYELPEEQEGESIFKKVLLANFAVDFFGSDFLILSHPNEKYSKPLVPELLRFQNDEQLIFFMSLRQIFTGTNKLVHKSKPFTFFYQRFILEFTNPDKAKYFSDLLKVRYFNILTFSIQFLDWHYDQLGIFESYLFPLVRVQGRDNITHVIDERGRSLYIISEYGPNNLQVIPSKVVETELIPARRTKKRRDYAEE